MPPLPQPPPTDIANRAFAGLPSAPRSRPHAGRLPSESWLLTLQGDPNEGLRLELNQRADGCWFWEYAENRFGQRSYEGVYDGFALLPKAPRLFASPREAQEHLLNIVRATFPGFPGRLHQRS